MCIYVCVCVCVYVSVNIFCYTNISVTGLKVICSVCHNDIMFNCNLMHDNIIKHACAYLMINNFSLLW